MSRRCSCRLGADFGVALQGVSLMCKRSRSPMMVPKWGAARSPASDMPDRPVEDRTISRRIDSMVLTIEEKEIPK